jgi:hypothetical protein
MPELDLTPPAAPVAADEPSAPPADVAAALDDTGALRLVPTPEPVAAAPRGALAGDLELFGLAGLLQTFQQSETTGRLSLRDAGNQLFAEIALHRGRLVEARAGRLSGPAALFQLLEEPRGGTFEFAKFEPASTTPAGARELIGLLLEGMRRYDELQRLRVVVPDDLVLRPGTTKPTAPEEETDGDFIRQVWERVRTGNMLVGDCAAALPADSYRLRALLAHWLESGAVTS